MGADERFFLPEESVSELDCASLDRAKGRGKPCIVWKTTGAGGWPRYKELFNDIHHGVDFRFEGKPLAIRHAGAFSDQVWRERKAEKSEGCIVLNATSCGSGIHLVKLDDVRQNVLK
jgi:hypothetical protein